MPQVPRRIVKASLDRQRAVRWTKFELNSFVESQPSLTWCPAPGGQGFEGETEVGSCVRGGCLALWRARKGLFMGC